MCLLVSTRGWTGVNIGVVLQCAVYSRLDITCTVKYPNLMTIAVEWSDNREDEVTFSASECMSYTTRLTQVDLVQSKLAETEQQLWP